MFFDFVLSRLIPATRRRLQMLDLPSTKKEEMFLRGMVTVVRISAVSRLGHFRLDLGQQFAACSPMLGIRVQPVQIAPRHRLGELVEDAQAVFWHFKAGQLL
jgi:hypothetical protein